MKLNWKVYLMKMATGHTGVQTEESIVLCLGSTPQEYWFMFHWKVDLKITTDHAGVQTGESFVLCLGSSPYEYWFMFHWKIDLMKLTTGNAGVQTGESFVLCLGSTPHELKSRLNEDYYRPCRSADRGVIIFFPSSSPHEYWFMFPWHHGHCPKFLLFPFIAHDAKCPASYCHHLASISLSVFTTISHFDYLFWNY